MSLGATGKHPEGKLVEHDEGEINIRIGSLHDNVVLQFGTPVKWLGFGPRYALEIAGAIRKHAVALLRQRDVLVQADTEHSQVLTTLLVDNINRERLFDEQKAREQALAAINALESWLSK